MHLFLFRHPEAQKNRLAVHGGCGTGLTEKGHSQARAMGAFLRQHLVPGKSILYYHWARQVRETVALIQEVFPVPLKLDDRLRGIHIGVLAGLSEQEARQQWPEAAKRLFDEWNRGNLIITNLNIPGQEPFDCFKERVSGVFDEWMKLEKDYLIFVGTRSVLIMLVNLIKMGKNFNPHHYQVYSFAPGSLTHVEFPPHSPPIFHRFNDTSHLQSCSAQS